MLVATDKSARRAGSCSAEHAGRHRAGRHRRRVAHRHRTGRGDGVGVLPPRHREHAASPVNPDKPFVFTLPRRRVGTTVIQGSSPRASNKGREVTVAGPFPPGTTAIQVAAEYPAGSGTVRHRAGVSRAVPEQVESSRRRSATLKLAVAAVRAQRRRRSSEGDGGHRHRAGERCRPDSRSR